MKIDYIRVRELRPYPNNARTHSKKQIRQIANSIGRFGFNNPVLIDDDKQIIAGHGRVEAAKLLGIDAVPTVRLSHLSEADKRAYILADNRLAEKAGWDREILAIELQALIDLDFEVELTGFEIAEIDLFLEEAREATGAPSGPEDAVPAALIPPPSPGPVTSGSWDRTAYCAPTPGTPRPMIVCSMAPRRSSSSPIRPTTFPSTVMSAASAVSGTAASPWAAVK